MNQKQKKYWSIFENRKVAYYEISKEEERNLSERDIEKKIQH